ncbi:MAG: right-handed parallel beta-helix repeat-containing protein [Clostridia bacterium]|nr:right-handed parallel beta-helix repeat-containing protein [Clostridia bacterium]
MRIKMLCSIFLALSVILLAGCAFFLDPEPTEDEIFALECEKKLRERVAEIRATESEYEVGENGTVYYVSNDGDDNNDGKSPETPIKTIRKLTSLQNAVSIKAGDVVLFRRGDMWRERFTAAPGITYSAYGEGDKPIFNGNTFGDAADPDKWELVEGTENIWKYKEHILDVGNIILNGGEKTAEKMLLSVDNKKFYVTINGKPFDLKSSFYQNELFVCEYLAVGKSAADLDTKTRLYLRCDEGNPGEVYDSIELAYRGNLIRGASGCTFDNLCIKYSGSHGIGMGTVNDVTVRNCEVGFVGGSAQYYTNGYIIRYGNGIEIYGGCENFTIDNCYVYQCYDAGITHQYGRENEVLQKNVYFTNNVIEKCIYNIEYFTPHKMENIVYSDNILAYSGHGWGMNPERAASIKGWDANNLSDGFVIKNNIFLLDRYNACDLGAKEEKWLPDFEGNTYVQVKGNNLTKIGSPNAVQYTFTDNALEILESLEEISPKVYFVRKR